MTTGRRRSARVSKAKAKPARARSKPPRAPAKPARARAKPAARTKTKPKPRPARKPPAGPMGLIFAQLDLPPELEDEFNDWYDHEHIPERLGLPGFFNGRRAERRRAPRYIALYDLDNLVVLESDQYKGCSGENRSAWTARMLKKTRKFERRLFEQLVPGREQIRADHPHTVVRFVPLDESAKDAQLAALRAHVADVRARPDATARLYDGREKALGTFLVLYTAQTEDAARALADAPFGGRVEVYHPYTSEPEESEAFTNIPADPRGATEAFYRRGYTDGLPILPPTDEAVEAMLATMKRPAGEVLGLMAPKQGEVTLEALAINSVMAGCRPEYFPIIVAAVEALLDPAFNLLGVQATTHPVTPLVIVSGPGRYELGFNLSGNAMGEGTQANATVGRAIRLILRNVGGGRPGKTDFTTQGSPARYGFCVAENEERSPFPPLHVARGFAAEDTVVTVCQAEGPHNVNDHSSQTGLSALKMIAGTLATFGCNDLGRGGHPTVALGPELAKLLARDGYTRESIQAFLCEHARVPPQRLPPEMQTWLRDRQDIDKSVWTEAGIPVGSTPEDFLVFVVGGDGRHSSIMPSFGFGKPVSRRAEYTKTGQRPPLMPECDC